MSDDIWRSDDELPEGARERRPGRLESEMDSFSDDEFGGPLFGDTSENPAVSGETDQPAEGLSFDDQSGSMPHWTEPPTGDIPEIPSAAAADPTDDLDVWSSFTSDSPVWKEGDDVDQPTGQQPVDPTGELSWEDAPADTAAADDSAQAPTADTDPEAEAEARGGRRGA